MKTGIHPTYNKSIDVQCICWNTFQLNAAVKWPVKIESCPACHPTYTWKIETKVTKGRMEKFLEKQKKMDSLKK